MELPEPEKYAAAALFTLAVHVAQEETCIPSELGAGHQPHAWGAPAEADTGDFAAAKPPRAEEDSEEDAAWDAFWGWDLCGEGGLLDRVYSHLDLGPSTWPALKLLPELATASGYRALIGQYRTALDSSLADAPTPQCLPDEAQHAEASTTAQAAPLLDAGDEADPDLEGDLRRARLRANYVRPQGEETAMPLHGPTTSSSARDVSAEKSGLQEGMAPISISALTDDAGTLEGRADVSLAQVDRGEPALTQPPGSAAAAPPTATHEASSAAAGGPSAAGPLASARTSEPAPKRGVPHLPSAPQALPEEVAPCVQSGDRLSASELAAAAARDAPPVAPSPQVMAAMVQVLDGCLARERMPTLADAAKAAKEGKPRHDHAEDVAAPPGMGSDPRIKQAVPAVRWYDARARVALQRLAAWLGVPWAHVAKFERLLAQQAQAPDQASPKARELTPAQRRARYLKIGAAAVGGGTLLAVTGGLAAPAIAAVAGPLLTMGGAAGAAGAVSGFMGSSVGAAAMIGGFGAGGAYATGGRMARRIGDVKEFGFRHVAETIPMPDHRHDKALELTPIPASPACSADPRLCLTVAVSGWVAGPEDFLRPWQLLNAGEGELFALVWESKELKELNKSLMQFIADKATQEAGKFLVDRVLVPGLIGAVTLPMYVLSAASFIDSTWAVVANRAEQAGILMAHVLMSGAHGDRPVTLVGYSMGARLIFHCLLELCRCKAKGVIEHAMLLGAPVPALQQRWLMARSVVAGRFVNGFSRNDWVLGLAFRAREMTKAASGLAAVPMPGVENIDLGSIVEGHTDYCTKMPTILARVGLV